LAGIEAPWYIDGNRAPNRRNRAVDEMTRRGGRIHSLHECPLKPYFPSGAGLLSLDAKGGA
jgi:hypothetical protein